VGSILEVATAQAQFASVQESLLQAQAARWTSLAALRRAVGLPVLAEVAR
jgi:outer membrane protein TolC